MFDNHFIFNIKCLPLQIAIEHARVFFNLDMLSKLLLDLKKCNGVMRLFQAFLELKQS